MKNTIKFRFAGIGIMLVTCAVFGVVVMLLWNALMPQIFTFPQISYLQSVGLLILARMLFGGMRDLGHSGFRAGNDRLFHHGNKFREKWMNMSDEERKEFMEKEKDFFKFNQRFSRFHEFFDDDGKPKRDGV